MDEGYNFIFAHCLLLYMERVSGTMQEGYWDHCWSVKLRLVYWLGIFVAGGF